jgi:hypothetical protein
MVDILLLLEMILFLIVIASATSFLIVSSRDLRRKAVLVRREKIWNSHTSMVVAKIDKQGQSR